MRHDRIDPGSAVRWEDPLEPYRRAPRAMPTVFRDREEAGRLLAERLARVVHTPCVVAAIPRGGVVVALPVADRLGAPLTVVYARKLTAPAAPEVAFGAVDEDGQVLVDSAAAVALGLDPADVDAARRRVAHDIERRIAAYGVPPLGRYLPGPEVVLVDDGLATGLTMQAALRYARRHGARVVTVAVPCASAAAAQHFEREADRFVSLVVDQEFVAVGAYYQEFRVVDDEVVRALLERARGEPPAAGGQRVWFRNARGYRLAGELLAPAGAPCPGVAVAHGRGSSKASPRNRAFAQALRSAGMAVLLFDFTGHGDSEGRETESTLEQQTDDLRAALEFLRRLPAVDGSRLGMIGASTGAAAVLRVAADEPAVRALVLRAPTPGPARAAAAKLRVPTLVVVGDRDPLARADSEALARDVAGARLELVPEGDHLLSEPRALAHAIRLVTQWMREHLGGGS